MLQLVAYVDLVTKRGLIIHIRSESRLDTNIGLTGIASVATGPLSVAARRGQRRLAWVFAENPLKALFFVTKKPLHRRERFGLLVIWPRIWLNQFTQTLPHRLPRLVLSSYVSPLDRLQVTAALIGATAFIGGVEDDGAPSARSQGTSPSIW